MKYIPMLVILVICLSLFSGIVNSTTGSIGNARAILNYELKAGDSINEERTIRVNNVNDEIIDIKLEVSESIKNIIELIDSEFELAPQQSLDARYNIKIKKEGTYDGTINVFFIPRGEGTAPILASRLIIIVKGEGDFSDIENDEVDLENLHEDNTKDSESSDNVVGSNDQPEDTGVTFNPTKMANQQSSNINPFMGFFLILVIIVLGLGIFYKFKKSSNKKGKEDEE